MGFGTLWRGVGLQPTRGLYGSSVNRWSIKRTPNGMKLDRRSTSSIPRPLGKSRSNPTMFNTRTLKEAKGAPDDVGVPECKMDNRENARMHETNMYANAMDTMRRYEMHDTDKMKNEDKTQPRGNILRAENGKSWSTNMVSYIRGVTSGSREWTHPGLERTARAGGAWAAVFRCW